jgi:hypothetical protein
MHANRENIVLEYRRSWKREIVYSLLILLSATVLVYVLLRLLADQGLMPKIIGWTLLLFNYSIFGWNIATLLKRREDFFCTLYEKYIECHVPVSGMGDSFQIALDDIAEIHLDNSGEDQAKIYLHTQDGRSLWLTSNFGNPARKLLRRIRQMRPEIPLTEGRGR